MQSRVAVLMGENELMLEGLRRILSDADFQVAATVGGVDSTHLDDILSNVSTKDLPILIILNIGSDHDALLVQVKWFKEQCSTAFIFLLADHNRLSDDNIVAALRCGANAYFLKPTCDILIKSIELVMAGEAILPATTLSLALRQNGVMVASEMENSAPVRMSPIAGAEASSAHCPRLSAQEQCILRRLIEGDSNKLIARKQGITEATVKVHVKAILRKTRLSNRTQAAIWGVNYGGFIDGGGVGSSAWVAE
jgi:two-component system nitrate/nitrite response regulator NarL